jgi:glycosyltransferase involved in cell wall biosynthesis
MVVRQRLLIISTTFFPHAAVGSVRMAQWSRFLPEFGWAPTVLCRYYGSEATPGLIAEKLHADVDVKYLDKPENEEPRVSGWRERILRSTRVLIADGQLGRTIVPHASISFWRAVRAQVLESVEQLRPDAILTTGPPHSNHDIGMWLTEKTGIPWVADFRDPYVIDRRYGPFGPLGRLRAHAHNRYEQAIYERAALLVHAIPLHARWARRRYPFARKRIRILPNGCPRELTGGDLKPYLAEGQRKSIRVIGRIGPGEALQIASALHQISNEGSELELRIVGAEPTNRTALARLLGERLVTTGPVRHEDALRHMVGADVLVSSLSREREGTLGLSSKLYEYLATGKPVIAINPTTPDRQLLRGVSGVQVLNRPGVPEVAAAIRSSLGIGAGPSREHVGAWRARYDRRVQTGVLAGWLHGLTNTAEPGPVAKSEQSPSTLVRESADD